jgi:uncharacterized protein YndB with AHSA1/START domain
VKPVINITSNAHIYHPIKKVFEFISNPENDFQWQYGTLSSIRTSEIIAALGASFQTTGNFMGHRIQSTFEVTEYDPNKKYGFKSLSGPLQSFTTYTFVLAHGYTQINLLTQANVVNFIELNENILEKKLKKQLKENLAMLKNILEVG